MPPLPPNWVTPKVVPEKLSLVQEQGSKWYNAITSAGLPTDEAFSNELMIWRKSVHGN